MSVLDFECINYEKHAFSQNEVRRKDGENMSVLDFEKNYRAFSKELPSKNFT